MDLFFFSSHSPTARGRVTSFLLQIVRDLRATIPGNIGYHLATWIVTVAMSVSFFAALHWFAQVSVGLKIAASLWVLWLTWKLFMAGTLKQSEAVKLGTLADGMFLLILNPKAYVIIALMFTQFLDQSGKGTLAAGVLITTLFTFLTWPLIGNKIAG